MAMPSLGPVNPSAEPHGLLPFSATVSELIQGPARTLSIDQTVKEAAQRMRQAGVGSLLVLERPARGHHHAHRSDPTRAGRGARCRVSGGIGDDPGNHLHRGAPAGLRRPDADDPVRDQPFAGARRGTDHRRDFRARLAHAPGARYGRIRWGGTGLNPLELLGAHHGEPTGIGAAEAPPRS